MNKKRIGYIVLALLGLGLITGFIVYKKVINPEHREIFEESTDFIIDAEDLQFHFLNDPEAGTLKYMNKVIETYGTVTEVGSNLIIIEQKIQANFLESNTQKVLVGDVIRIKGRCIGFDEFLLLVKIDQATTIKTN
ncbi:OB-fold protein [Croceitalea rosinachiae]|uniref:tRNA_anti-like n=1 Tax=Croceitalea rosinachiae TaxID=3075596 RepID=A0ABU3AC63_9FLAO|nr:hypothetical protein [Croceitalea sp. F388]MDT0607774.1 hypothetical protein [Croceitalea sp. F388]